MGGGREGGKEGRRWREGRERGGGGREGVEGEGEGARGWRDMELALSLPWCRLILCKSECVEREGGREGGIEERRDCYYFT